MDKLLNKVAENKKNHFWIFLSILTCLSVVMMYCYQLYPGHDFHFHLRRFQALIDAFRNGDIISYLDYGAVVGYGYFSKAFYCDFLLIPFAAIGLYTDVITAYKIMIFSMTIITGICTYWAINGIYNNSYAASVSALLYTFAYYRIVDVYRRGALGESWALAFVPLIFWGLYLIINGDCKRWYILVIGYSLLVFSHVLSSIIMAVTTIIILAIYYKQLIKEPKRLLYLLLAACVSFLLTACYLLPMIEQLASNSFYFQTIEPMKAESLKMEPYRIIWGMFLGIVYPLQGFIPGIGILLTWAASLRLFVREKSNIMKSIDIALIISIIFLFAQSWYFPWEIFPFNKLNFIQFPWRLNLVVSFLLAYSGGYCFYKLLATHKRLLVGLVSVCAFISIILVSDGQCYKNEWNGRPLIEEPNVYNYYHIIGAEYMPSKVPSPVFLEKRGQKIETDNESVKIQGLTKRNGITTFVVSVDRLSRLELPLVWYKGYKANLNNGELNITQSNSGLIEIPIKQSGTVQVYYEGTLVQKISFFITIISIIGICIYIYRSKKEQLKHEIYQPGDR